MNILVSVGLTIAELLCKLAETVVYFENTL